MPRLTKSVVGAINVRIEDKARRDYPELMKAIHRLKLAVPVRGTDHLILTAFGEDSSNPRLRYTGVLGKFTDISPDAEWLNTIHLKRAEKVEKDDIRIPNHLKPNFSAFYLALLPRDHVLTFEVQSEGKRLPPTSVERWLRTVTSHRAIYRNSVRST